MGKGELRLSFFLFGFPITSSLFFLLAFKFKAQSSKLKAQSSTLLLIPVTLVGQKMYCWLCN
ncbi:hypothetical protein, partial [Photobacterium sp. OFAV2-7]|uniref:hypothetical protein n=1 Tax=Photobacterium sp. OFAV2-7 TaxID=2917748 RepID=UPI001EF6A896